MVRDASRDPCVTNNNTSNLIFEGVWCTGDRRVAPGPGRPGNDGGLLWGKQNCCAASIARGGGCCGAIAKQRQSRALALHPPVVQSPRMLAFRIATVALPAPPQGRHQTWPAVAASPSVGTDTTQGAWFLLPQEPHPDSAWNLFPATTLEGSGSAQGVGALAILVST
jgi:hypothetical protein